MEVVLQAPIHDELVAEQLLVGAVVVANQLHQVPMMQPAQHLHLHLELTVPLVAPHLHPNNAKQHQVAAGSITPTLAQERRVFLVHLSESKELTAPLVQLPLHPRRF
jgi:hypothetical protein